MAKQKVGLKRNGTLKKGYKYAKGGRIVKAKKDTDGVTPSMFGGKVVKAKRSYTKGSTSNKKADGRKKALKPGKRISRNGNVYYESRRNRSDVRGRK